MRSIDAIESALGKVSHGRGYRCLHVQDLKEQGRCGSGERRVSLFVNVWYFDTANHNNN